MNDSKNNQTENEQNNFYLKIVCLFVFALFIVGLYIVLGLKYNVLFSDIARNLWLLFFAIFGGGLAIWGRKATQTQLENTERQLQLTAKQSEHTERQLKNSAKINRNDRFAKAAEMLSDNKSKILSRGGLYILRDLIEENSDSEYIRCVDIISYWLVELGRDVEKSLLDVAIIIIRLGEFIDNLEDILDEHRMIFFLDFWPNLQHIHLENVNLEGVDFSKADMYNAQFYNAILLVVNFKGANLHDAGFGNANLEHANLQDADLTNTFMRDVKNLTKEQILSAKWRRLSGGSGHPTGNPELPHYLTKDPDVQEWLSKPTPDKTKKH